MLEMKMRLQVMSLATLATLAGAPGPASAQSGSPLGSLFSCSAPGSTNTTGAVIGGIAGAALGSQVSKNERALGAVLGAGLGAVAGNWVGCRMQTSSQQRAQAAFQTALDTGRTQTWRDSTGASGRVEVISAGPAAEGYAAPASYRDLSFDPGVARINRPLSPAAASYTAASRVNLRAAPSTSAPVVGRLEPGRPVSAAGQVDGFVVVHDRGVVRGYVASSVVRPSAGPSQARADCRLVEQTTTVPGQGTQAERFNACRDGSGQWRVERV
jgi:surface antigen